MIDIKLMQGDCLDKMNEIPDNSVNLILCDLPYGSTACSWDVVIPFDKLWEQYRRVIKRDGAIVLFGSQPFTSLLIASQIDLFKYSWVWVKNRATGHVHSKNKPMKKHEDICVFSFGSTVHKSQAKNRMKYNPQGLIKMTEGVVRKRNDKGDDTVLSYRESHHITKYEYKNYPDSILYYDIEMGKKRFHPTQKPVLLLEYLIKTYTDEGDVVLDNCMGSGSTGVACVNTNRNFIGIEKDYDYFCISEKRIRLNG